MASAAAHASVANAVIEKAWRRARRRREWYLVAGLLLAALGTAVLTTSNFGGGTDGAPGATPLGGKSNAADRADYVRKNEAVLRELPVPRGARRFETSTLAYFDGDSPAAKVAGYWTIRRFERPRSMTAPAVISFYERELRDPWRVVQESRAPALSLLGAGSYLHVLVGRRDFLLEVDHAWCADTDRLHCRSSYARATASTPRAERTRWRSAPVPISETSTPSSRSTKST